MMVSVLEMAQHWYGYGRWEAPYWFVGIEPGGDELNEFARLWRHLGSGELLDIVAHHKELRWNWFDEGARTQPTWMKLIWLLLTYKGQEPTRDATLEYQKRHLGRIDGETALTEISCIPARHNGVPVPLREQYRAERIAKISKLISEHAPKFVVFYSSGSRYRSTWDKIAGCQLTPHKPIMVERTACVITSHPTRERSKAYWSNMGLELRAMR